MERPRRQVLGVKGVAAGILLRGVGRIMISIKVDRICADFWLQRV
jgi:hypothetical protein